MVPSNLVTEPARSRTVTFTPILNTVSNEQSPATADKQLPNRYPSQAHVTKTTAATIDKAPSRPAPSVTVTPVTTVQSHTQTRTTATADPKRPPSRSDNYRSNLQLLQYRATMKPPIDSNLTSSDDEIDNSANIAAALAARKMHIKAVHFNF